MGGGGQVTAFASHTTGRRTTSERRHLARAARLFGCLVRRILFKDFLKLPLPRPRTFDGHVLVEMRAVLRQEPLFVMFPEYFARPRRLLGRHPEQVQQIFGGLQTGGKGLAVYVRDADIHQPVDMIAVARPRQDSHVRKLT